MRAQGLLKDLQEEGYETSWRSLDLPYVADREINTLPIVASYCQEIAETVYEVVREGKLFTVLGGDHSCAIGTWSGAYRALRGQGRFGMIWVDAHMDSHTTTTSHSGAIHGMPLAALLGHGDPTLTRIGAAEPKLLPQNVALIGVRSYEPEEAELLESLGVRIFYIEEVQRRGLTACFEEALTIARRNTLAYGVSIDLDAIDPSDAPGVGSPEPNGLRGDELIDALSLVKDSDDLLGLEIVELNPNRDQRDKTAKLASQLLLAAI